MANVLGSVVVQDLTYTQARHGLAFMVTYENGGTAGSETVKLDGIEIKVKIASGTSTATQIRAAFNLCPEAVALATCTVSGTGSNVQKSCVRAFLSGGATAVKSAIALARGLRLEAVTAGTAGNSIRIKFVNAGSVSVSAAASDITINVNDTVSTYGAVMRAIRASATVGALIQPFCPTDINTTVVNISTDSLPVAFTALSGGTAASAPAVVVQDLTITSVTTGPTSNRTSITYTTGATAGAEVVTLNTNGDVTVQIQNGVSTATQINAALGAAGAFTALYTSAISGVGATAQKTVNQAGGTALASEATPSTKDFYSDQSITALTTTYAAFNFGFHAESIVVSNDETSGVKTVTVSLNGTDAAAVLNPGESISLDRYGVGAVVSLKGNGPSYRLTAVGV